MSEKTKYKKYDHSASISRQIDRVNELISTGVTESEHNDFNLYFNSVVMSLMSLDAMLDPFKDKKFDEIFGDDFNPKRLNRGAKLQLVYDAMTELTNLMYRRNLFYASHTQEVIGGKD